MSPETEAALAGFVRQRRIYIIGVALPLMRWAGRCGLPQTNRKVLGSATGISHFFQYIFPPRMSWRSGALFDLETPIFFFGRGGIFWIIEV